MRVFLGSIAAFIFVCYGPIVWNLDLPDYSVFEQGVDKINWYCGNAFQFERRCNVIELHPYATVLIPKDLTFINEL